MLRKGDGKGTSVGEPKVVVQTGGNPFSILSIVDSGESSVIQSSKQGVPPPCNTSSLVSLVKKIVPERFLFY